jgi:hypothetical protein
MSFFHILRISYVVLYLSEKYAQCSCDWPFKKKLTNVHRATILTHGNCVRRDSSDSSQKTRSRTHIVSPYCDLRASASVSFSPNLFISRCSKASPHPPPPSNRHSFPVVYVYVGCQGSYGRKTVSRVYFLAPPQKERAIENVQEMYISYRICYPNFRGVACYVGPPLDCALQRVNSTPNVTSELEFVNF